MPASTSPGLFRATSGTGENQIICISLDRKRIVFYELCSSAPRKISGSSSSPFTKELAHPPKKDGGFAEGYGAVSDSELSALLAADEEFNASLDLARIISGNERDRCERNNLHFLGSKTHRLL